MSVVGSWALVLLAGFIAYGIAFAWYANGHASAPYREPGE